MNRVKSRKGLSAGGSPKMPTAVIPPITDAGSCRLVRRTYRWTAARRMTKAADLAR